MAPKRRTRRKVLRQLQLKAVSNDLQKAVGRCWHIYCVVGVPVIFLAHGGCEHLVCISHLFFTVF